MRNPIRVLIADDHTLLREGMRLLLDTLEGVEVVGEAGDGTRALELIEAEKPDVALMDIAMPGLNGLEALRRAAKQNPSTRILMVSAHADATYVHDALRSGAAGYLLKGADRNELETALRTVAAGGSYVTTAIPRAQVNGLAKKEASGPAQSAADVLTSRQREILQLMAEGCTTKQVAARLGLSAKTVESHRANLMQRLGIRDVPGLVRFAIRTGLATTDR